LTDWRLLLSLELPLNVLYYLGNNVSLFPDFFTVQWSRRY